MLVLVFRILNIILEIMFQVFKYKVKKVNIIFDFYYMLVEQSVRMGDYISYLLFYSRIFQNLVIYNFIYIIKCCLVYFFFMYKLNNMQYFCENIQRLV